MTCEAILLSYKLWLMKFNPLVFNWKDVDSITQVFHNAFQPHHDINSIYATNICYKRFWCAHIMIPSILNHPNQVSEYLVLAAQTPSPKTAFSPCCNFHPGKYWRTLRKHLLAFTVIMSYTKKLDINLFSIILQKEQYTKKYNRTYIFVDITTGIYENLCHHTGFFLIESQYTYVW